MNKTGDGSCRDDFLLKMYDQMFNNINRHIMITWEVVPVVGGALGAIALTETAQMPVSVAASMIVMLAGWLCAHSLDANEWVKRNLYIISNIERQYLESSDSVEVHYYFKLPHEVEILRHFQIQIVAAIVVAAAAVGWVLFDTWSSKEHSAFVALFTLTLILVVLSCELLRRRTNKRLEQFRSKSPGRRQTE